ncbi:MAG: TetR/AcrR family transcriptional regulator [Ornithinimicrobium sp.]
MPKVTPEHRAARRQHILEAAMRRVAIDGYHKMTMADVIAESDLSAGAVYGYFRSKDELITAVALQVSGLARSVVEDILTLDPMPDPPEVLRRLTQTFVDAVETSPVDLSRVIVTTWGEAVRSPEVRDIVRDEFRGVRARFVDVLDAVQAAGHLDPEVDTTAAAQALFGMMPGFMLQRLVLQDVDPDTYSEGLRALLGGSPGAGDARAISVSTPRVPTSAG